MSAGFTRSGKQFAKLDADDPKAYESKTKDARWKHRTFGKNDNLYFYKFNLETRDGEHDAVTLQIINELKKLFGGALIHANTSIGGVSYMSYSNSDGHFEACTVREASEETVNLGTGLVRGLFPEKKTQINQDVMTNAGTGHSCVDFKHDGKDVCLVAGFGLPRYNPIHRCLEPFTGWCVTSGSASQLGVPPFKGVASMTVVIAPMNAAKFHVTIKPGDRLEQFVQRVWERGCVRFPPFLYRGSPLIDLNVLSAGDTVYLLSSKQ